MMCVCDVNMCGGWDGRGGGGWVGVGGGGGGGGGRERGGSKNTGLHLSVWYTRRSKTCFVVMIPKVETLTCQNAT